MATLPNAISVFPTGEQARVHQTAVRYALSCETEAADVYIEEHFQTVVAGAYLGNLGAPDTSENPIIAIGNHVSTPGHYGITPTILGPDSDKVAPLFDQLWPRKQHAEFLAFALGCVLIRSDHSTDLGRLVHRLVMPQDTWCIPHPQDPTIPITLFHLRVRSIKAAGGAIEDRLAWDVWDISNQDAPRFAVVEALGEGKLGSDWTEQVTGKGALVGDAYPCKYPNGRPFIPYDFHRWKDVGDLYNWQMHKGAFRGTLSSMFVATCALKAAHGATGKTHLISGVTVSGASVTKDSSGNAIARISLNPGEAVFGVHEPGTSPFGYAMDAGDNLKQLADFQQRKASAIVLSTGITPTDATRTSANPMSGAALHLTNAMKRDIQAMQAPLCRQADLSTIAKGVALWNAAQESGPELSADGIGIAYQEIAKSPDEERQEREDLDWEIANGMRSRVDVYMARHPGVEREAAVLELRRVMAEEASLTQQPTATPPPAAPPVPPLPADPGVPA